MKKVPLFAVTVAVIALCVGVYFSARAGLSNRRNGKDPAPTAGRTDLPASVTQAAAQDELNMNAGCYVCHMTFLQESLSVVHLEADVGCVHCHGLSDGHANDENIGETPPDKIFEHDQINAFCRDCHATHDVRAELLVARWMERSRDKGIAATEDYEAVCTDCHGRHTIAGL